MTYDRIIIGAGLYGLYSALRCARRGEQVLVLEHDDGSFMRATYINQARVHMGYHYPRSLSTAVKSAGYFKRFNEDYGFCINTNFEQIYATSSAFSWTDAREFTKFCRDAGIRCDEVNAEKYFNPGMCDGAFLTEEYTYDAQILKQYFVDMLAERKNCQIIYNARVESIVADGGSYLVVSNNISYRTRFILNATYASVNQIHRLLNISPFKIKYELCEIILCQTSKKLQRTGLTVMDGPFFSIMPFGKTGYHSLTSVTFTPHSTSYDDCPDFECQERSEEYCSVKQLGNCNSCPAKPDTAWPYMSALAKKYIRNDLSFAYTGSLFSMKPILKASEIDDSRPTVVRIFTENPTFVSVLSGKINTVYDLDEVLDNGY